MTTKTIRKIIKIDEEKCDGCGLCVPACPEGALQIVNGKAKLVKESFCDGLGACLGECPRGAITIEERTADEFEQAAVKYHLAQEKPATEEHRFSCPSAAVKQFEKKEAKVIEKEAASSPSMLSHWPIQLTLVPPTAPFLHGADLMLVADCVPFAYAGFHQDFLQGRALLVACPKLDDFPAHLKKLAEILRQSEVKSLTVMIMEVPCCFSLVQMAKRAIALSGKDIPLNTLTIGVRGELKSRKE